MKISFRKLESLKALVFISGISYLSPTKLSGYSHKHIFQFNKSHPTGLFIKVMLEPLTSKIIMQLNFTNFQLPAAKDHME